MLSDVFKQIIFKKRYLQGRRHFELWSAASKIKLTGSWRSTERPCRSLLHRPATGNLAGGRSPQPRAARVHGAWRADHRGGQASQHTGLEPRPRSSSPWPSCCRRPTARAQSGPGGTSPTGEQIIVRAGGQASPTHRARGRQDDAGNIAALVGDVVVHVDSLELHIRVAL